MLKSVQEANVLSLIGCDSLTHKNMFWQTPDTLNLPGQLTIPSINRNVLLVAGLFYANMDNA